MVNQYVNWKPRQAREHQVATSFVYLIGWVVDARIFNQSLSSVKENQELTGARKTENWAVSGAFEKWTPRKTVRQSAGKLANTSQVVILFFFFILLFISFSCADEEYYENLTFSSFQIFTKAGCFIAGKSPEWFWNTCPERFFWTRANRCHWLCLWVQSVLTSFRFREEGERPQ